MRGCKVGEEGEREGEKDEILHMLSIDDNP